MQFLNVSHRNCSSSVSLVNNLVLWWKEVSLTYILWWSKVCIVTKRYILASHGSKENLWNLACFLTYIYTFFQGLAPADVAIQQVKISVCKQTTFEVIFQPGSVRFQQAKAYGTTIEVSTELLLVCGRLLMAFDLTISAAPSLSTSNGNVWVGIFFSAMM